MRVTVLSLLFLVTVCRTGVFGEDIDDTCECCKINCPIRSDPVCASNNVTYDNECLFQYSKKCADLKDVTLVSKGKCKDSGGDQFSDEEGQISFKANMGDGNIATFSMQDPQYASRGRPGNSDDTNSCDRVYNYIPRHLTFITRYPYYRKYTHAYQIPIISSAAVSDRAMKRACYVLQFMLADRRRVRQAMYKNWGRVGVIGTYEHTTSIPEHSRLGSQWNARARGLGGTIHIPISTGTEENILCDKRTDRYRDRYPREDIFLHEFCHGIESLGVGPAIPGWFTRLTNAYNSARYRGLWRNTYAMSTVQEYFAEGTQSYFEVNNYSAYPNGVHGPTNTREKLRRYDPTLYALVKEVFPCMNQIWKRCDAAHNGKKMPPFYMNCDGDGTRKQIGGSGGGGGGGRVTQPPVVVTRGPPTTLSCSDENQYCGDWARKGFCFSGSYKEYMMGKCTKSCGCCTDKNASCAGWKSYCKNSQYLSWMTENCMKTCQVCQQSKK